MTNESLHNLSREELIALAQTQQQQIESLQQQLARRVLIMEEAGSIARAAMELNEVFLASQRAADQYLESTEAMKTRQESECALRLTQAEAQCRDMITHAEESAQFYWDALNRRIEELMAAQSLPQAEPVKPTEEATEGSFGPDD